MTFLADVRQRLHDVGESLLAAGVAGDCGVSDADGGAELTVTRAGDHVPARLTVTGTTEAFLLHLGDDYSEAVTAYDDEDRWEAVAGLTQSLTAFMWRDYYEEAGERHGRVVRKVLHLTVPGGEQVIAAKSGAGGILGRIRGYSTTILRPGDREG